MGHASPDADEQERTRADSPVVCARQPSVDEHRCEVVARLLASGVSPTTLRVLIPEWQDRLAVEA